jgi:hypothetical protein
MSNKLNKMNGGDIKDSDHLIQPKAKSDTICAPSVKYEDGSCARLEVLIELAKAYNMSCSEKDKIELNQTIRTANPAKYKRYLVKELDRRIGDKCNTQKCWSQQEFVQNMEYKAREELLKHTHRPDSPQGRFAWLSTLDINKSMEQYEKKYKGFKFFGAVPMDFAELPQLEVSDIDYDELLKNNITRIGIIFNLDEHYKSGSHWVAMYTDLKEGNIFYFDSYGVEPEPRVRKLMREQIKFIQSKGMKIENIRADHNRYQHQKEGSECGVYSMNFLIRMARGDDFDKLCENIVPDKKINKCRLVYFDRDQQTKNK